MSNPQDVMVLFTRCVDVPRADRKAFALRECRDDRKLLEAVERLLDVYEQGTDYLESAADASDGGTGAPDPTEIDSYRVLERLGEGGFGAVYLAEQTDPIQRQVALKLLKRGMDSTAVLRRFEVERQALAQMDHPNVASVLDAGVAPDGRPYFVMQYVPGRTICACAEEQRLSTAERLRLFQRVCDGVQHAHQKGIIHRDIKPANVLVTAVGDEHVPVVIDFGIAKATDARIAGATTFTQHGSIMGTPEYMSPEQADLTNNDIDTRSDVYSLGVLLYELLVGDLPISADVLRQHGYGEMLRVIQEVDPPKPSTRASTLATTSLRAERRGSETRSLSRELRGDLDWIVMKALEKDRDRRYSSPGDLSADVQRYLNFDPVLAGPPSATYRFKKFVRKNRGAVLAASVLLVAIMGGLLTSLWFWHEAEDARLASERDRGAAVRDRDRARDAAKAERIAKEEAVAAGVLAAEREKEAREARAREAARAEDLQVVAGFQAEQLAGIDVPTMAVGLRAALLEQVQDSLEARYEASDAEVRLAQFRAGIEGVDFIGVSRQLLEQNILQRTLGVVRSEFSDQRLIQARLLEAVSTVSRDLGLYALALEPQRKALAIHRELLGSDHSDTLTSVANLGVLLRAQGKLVEAGPFYKEALETCRRVLGNEHEKTVEALSNIGQLLRQEGKLNEAHDAFREAIETGRAVLGDEHRKMIAAISSMGTVLQQQGKYQEAMAHFKEALSTARRVLDDDHPYTQAAVSAIGGLYFAREQFSEAKPFLAEALDVAKRLHGDDHPSTLLAMNNMALVLFQQGDIAGTASYLEKVLAARRRLLGSDHPQTINSITNLGLFYKRQDQLGEAERYLTEGLAALERVLGADHPRTLKTIHDMGGLLQDQGKFDQALEYIEKGLAARRRVLGNEHPATLDSVVGAGWLFQVQGKFAEAVPFLREALDMSRRIFGSDHQRTLLYLSTLASALNDSGSSSEAVVLFDEALTACRRTMGDDDPRTLKTIHNTSSACRRAKLLDRALPLAEEAVRRARVVMGAAHWQVGVFLANKGGVLLDSGEYSEAATALEEAHAILNTTVGEKDERTVDLLPLLVSCYSKWHAAEPDGGHDERLEYWQGK